MWFSSMMGVAILFALAIVTFHESRKPPGYHAA
jgi:hypothetical protein